MHLPGAAAATATALASGVLIPLYIDPVGGPQCSGWASLLSSIEAHPRMPFYAIINPDSGPGGANTQPGAEYQQCIPILQAASDNVIVLGYVASWDADSSKVSGVTQDVNTYAGWDAAYRVDGIFFDQVSGTAADFSTYQSFVSHARKTFDFVRAMATIALNPGTAVSDTAYYNLADILLTAENFFDDFSPSQLSLGSSTPASKQAIVLTDGPSTPPTSLISQLVTTDEVGAFWVTDDTQANGQNPYDTLPSDIEAFVDAIKAAQS
ncbi:Spherulation-specific family 4 [Dichomitus squalens]|uniref:Spherulation-specific family 4 n=1 Tax=Dichomitus squalens TaxID=114155 RepID=A0A4Q9PTC6_9APHY|nr:Spherulation-specific family 4 [Dichomitus squalens]